MLYCRQCKVSVGSVFKHCPLCASTLSGSLDPDSDVFPVIAPRVKPYKGLIRLIAFGTIVAAVLSIAVDIAINSPTDLGWSLFVAAGLASLWLSFAIANKRRKNISKNIFWQLVILSGLEILWDYCTGFHKWSFSYVIPIMFSASIAALSILAYIKKLQASDYMIILLIINIISVCALLLIIFNLVTVIYPALVCFTFSLISAAKIIIFEGKFLQGELKRRMHI